MSSYKNIRSLSRRLMLEQRQAGRIEKEMEKERQRLLGQRNDLRQALSSALLMLKIFDPEGKASGLEQENARRAITGQPLVREVKVTSEQEVQKIPEQELHTDDYNPYGISLAPILPGDIR